MKLTTREMTLVAIFPALMAATSWISIPMVGAPITLQTLFVMLAGLLLGSRIGPLSVSIYVILGALGLPIFAGFTGGMGVILGPTGGFIVGFIVMAHVIGIFKDKLKIGKFINNEYVEIFIILILATIVLYIIGGAWLMTSLNLTLRPTLGILVVYLPGDLVKILVALYAYVYIRSYVTYEYS